MTARALFFIVAATIFMLREQSAVAQPAGSLVASPRIEHVSGNVNVQYGDITFPDGTPVTLKVSANFPDDKLEQLALRVANRVLPEMKQANQAHQEKIKAIDQQLKGIQSSTRWVVNSVDRLEVQLKQLTEVVNEIWTIVLRLDAKIDILTREMENGATNAKEQSAQLLAIRAAIERLLNKGAYDEAKHEAEAQRFLLEPWSSFSVLGLFGVHPASSAWSLGGELRYRQSISSLTSPLFDILDATWVSCGLDLSYARLSRELLQVGRPGEQVVGRQSENVLGLAAALGILFANRRHMLAADVAWRGWLLDLPNGRLETSLTYGHRFGRTRAWFQIQGRAALFDTGVAVENQRYNPFGPPTHLQKQQLVSLFELSGGPLFNF